MDQENNKTKQMEEVEALTSIYAEDFMVESETHRSYTIKIKEHDNEVLFSVTMPWNYPLQAPPKYEFSAPWMDRKAKEALRQHLEEVYLENIGETVIFQWVERIREMLYKIKPPKDYRNQKKQEAIVAEKALDISQHQIKCPEITHGEVIIDRKSRFQGHAAEVHSMEDVTAVLNRLHQNRKIENATHNMYAYRFERKTSKGTVIVQDCNDDGEAHAGGRMMHLLQILDQKNTLVVVSRWFGGVQLGPDRFRHINNASRQAIQAAGLLKK